MAMCSLIKLFSKTVSKKRLLSIAKNIATLKEKTMGERILRTLDNYKKSKAEEVYLAGLLMGKMIAFNDIGVTAEMLKANFEKTRKLNNDVTRYIG